MAQYQFDLYSVTLLIAAILSAGVAAYAWSQRRAHSAVALSLMALAICVWTLGHAFEMAGITYSAKMFWAKINNIGIVAAPVTWLIFAMRHTLRGKRIPMWVMLGLWVVPLISLTLVFTNEMHHLFWSAVELVQTEYFITFHYTFGPWFLWVHAVYSYLLLFIGAVMIIRSLARREGVYRGQAVALLVAALAPLAGNIIFLVPGVNPIPDLDWAPFGFTVTIICLAWAIFGYQLVNISPLARDLLVDSIPDGMIVLDVRGHIADINQAAGRMIGVPLANAIGKPLREVLSPWPYVIERFRDVTEASEEIVVGEGEARRRYEIRLAPLQGQMEQSLGQMIIIRDVSEGVVPQPRFAPRDAEAFQPAEVDVQPDQEAKYSIPVLKGLIQFVTTPLKTDLPTPPNVNPKWFQARERSFTLILRLAALLGTAALLIAPSFSNFRVSLPFVIIIGLMWFLGLVRTLNFNLRTAVFLVLIYTLAFTETYSFGYSVESFTFFMALSVSAVLLFGRNGGLAVFAVSVITLGVFGVQIGRGAFVPPSAFDGVVMPTTVQRATTALVAFSACAVAMIASASILMESLNRAWQLEMQALNLLQQERDLLEIRIQERTRDLAQARDDAVKISNELRKYFLAIEQSGNTIVITDSRGNIEYANPRFTQLTGYTQAEAINQNMRILQSGEHERGFYETMWETIRTGKIWHGEFHNRRKDGSLFWETATIAPVLDSEGQITNYVAIKQDITAQKQLQQQLHEQNEQMAREINERVRAETRLHESEARFRQLVESASDLIYLTDREGYFTYVNPAGLRVTGFREHELVGRRFLDVVVPEARHKTERFYLRQVMRKIPTTYQEFPIIAGDGSEIWLGQNVQIILDGDQVVGLQALGRDVTERKRFEDALSLARDQALEASQVKSQLLSKVNHELRTPLGAILGFAELLRTGVFGPLAQAQTEAVGQIVDSVNYLTGIVNELLDAAQIEARKLTLQMEACNPGHILKQVETSMAVLAHNKGLAFSTQISPELPITILGDERRLKQILINLVGNAIKFTQAGEVCVRLFCPDAGHWAMQVSDTGVGIPPEAQGYIFEPFRQVQGETSTRDFRGTGLGLSITRQLVELMGGEIILESEVSRGSTFTVKLPIRRQSEMGTRPLVPFNPEKMS